MSEVSNLVEEVKTEVEAVVEKAKEFFIYEKAHIQAFLDYLAKRPYSEVFEIIETMKLGKPVIVNTVPAAPVAPVETPVESTPAQ